MEDILEPELLICDPHHHLWDLSHPTYTYRYMTEDLRADAASGHRIEKTVFIQCRSGYRSEGPEAFRPVGEPAFVVAADPDGFIAGIVGYADLRSAEIDDILDALKDAGAGRLRGIRHSSTYDPSNEIPSPANNPPGLLSDSAFRAGFAKLGRAGLSYDAWLYHPQIPELTDLARAHPDVPIVVDHLGGPIGVGPYAGHRDEVMAQWRSAMTELATCPNVTIKLGGIGMPIFGQQWHEKDGGASSDEIAQLYGADIRWCIEQFGVDRCMFESNFPVDRASCSYVALWNGFKKIASDASPNEKQALFHDTATTFYRV